MHGARPFNCNIKRTVTSLLFCFAILWIVVVVLCAICVPFDFVRLVVVRREDAGKMKFLKSVNAGDKKVMETCGAGDMKVLET